jgi:hypothetical protein
MMQSRTERRRQRCRRHKIFSSPPADFRQLRQPRRTAGRDSLAHFFISFKKFIVFAFPYAAGFQLLFSAFSSAFLSQVRQVIFRRRSRRYAVTLAFLFQPAAFRRVSIAAGVSSSAFSAPHTPLSQPFTGLLASVFVSMLRRQRFSLSYKGRLSFCSRGRRHAGNAVFFFTPQLAVFAGFPVFLSLFRRFTLSFGFLRCVFAAFVFIDDAD